MGLLDFVQNIFGGVSDAAHDAVSNATENIPGVDTLQQHAEDLQQTAEETVQNITEQAPDVSTEAEQVKEQINQFRDQI